MIFAVFPCAGQRTQGRLPLEIRIDLGQKRFITKESMVLRISIRNTGSSPIEVPNPENNRNSQPVYTIDGPSYPKGHSFHFRSVALGDARPATQTEPGMMIKLAPGSRMRPRCRWNNSFDFRSRGRIRFPRLSRPVVYARNRRLWSS